MRQVASVGKSRVALCGPHPPVSNSIASSDKFRIRSKRSLPSSTSGTLQNTSESDAACQATASISKSDIHSTDRRVGEILAQELLAPGHSRLQAEMVLNNFRTALCGRRPPVGLHFAGLTHPSPIVIHLLANLGSDLREACSRLHPELCRMPADLIRPARPRRPARPKRLVMISRLTQVAVSRAAIPGVRGARRGLLPAGPPLEKRVSPVSAFPSGPSAPWPLELLACDRLPQLANLLPPAP